MDSHAIKWAEDLIRQKKQMLPRAVTLRVVKDKWPGGELIEFNGYFWAWSAKDEPGDMIEVTLSHPRLRSDYDWP